MSVAGISSTNIAAQPGLLGTFQQQRNDFKQLSTALQSGDLTGAQAAFTDLAKLSQNSKAGAQSSTSQIGQDFAAIGQALQSGDLAGAQQAFSTFQQDVKSAFQQRFQNPQAQQTQQQPSVHHHHHHHDAGNSGASNSSQSAASNGDSISITDASGDKITINLGAASGSSNGGAEQVTLNFGNNSGPEQVTLNLSGNENVTLNFGAANSSTSTSQSTGSQLNVSA